MDHLASTNLSFSQLWQSSIPEDHCTVAASTVDIGPYSHQCHNRATTGYFVNVTHVKNWVVLLFT